MVSQKLSGKCKLEEANSQQNILICQLKYQKFVFKSKRDDKKRFQQTEQGRAYSLSEVKENLFILSSTMKTRAHSQY